MKNVCFIGAYDKLELILCIAKILKMLGNEILIIDATELQKSKYIVPTINPTTKYITSFEDIDIALGFESYDDIENYILETEGKKLKYTYALVNIDDQDKFVNFNNEATFKNYFVTNLELYAIRKGLDTIKKIKKPIKVEKVIFSRNFLPEDEQYIDFYSLGYKIIWDENKIKFPYEIENMEAMMESQKNFKITIRNLSVEYKSALENLISDIIPDINISNIRKIMKNLEKEG